MSLWKALIVAKEAPAMTFEVERAGIVFGFMIMFYAYDSSKRLIYNESVFIVQEPCQQIRSPSLILLITGDFRKDLHYIITFKRKKNSQALLLPVFDKY